MQTLPIIAPALPAIGEVAAPVIAFCMTPAGWVVCGAAAIGVVGGACYAMSHNNDGHMQSTPVADPSREKNCQALKDSILKTCASLTGRKKFACFQAAQTSYEQCMAD